VQSPLHDPAVLQRHILLAERVTRGQIDAAVRGGRWIVVGRGVYLDKHRSTDLARSVLIANLISAGPEANLSHQSAAEQHHFDSTKPRPAGCWISVPANSARRSSNDVHIFHRHTAIATTAIDDLPVTTRAQTVVDLASILGDEELERVLESALRGPDNRQPHIWRTDVLDEINTLISLQPRSTAALTEVLGRRPSGCRPTGSIAETMLLQLLRARGIDVIRQPRVLIYDKQGRFNEYFPDFIVVAGCALIEVDGSDHFNETRARSDAKRQNNFVGFNVFRVTAAQVMFEPSAFVNTIVNHVRQLRWTTPEWKHGGRLIRGAGDEWEIRFAPKR
jgi:very-short-patch-repair endonuclease